MNLDILDILDILDTDHILNRGGIMKINKMLGKAKYDGSSIRSRGEKSTKIDPEVPKQFEEFSVASGRSRKIYLVCKKILANGKRCDYSIRKDTFFANVDKHLNHKCAVTQIEQFFPQTNQTVEIDQFTALLFDFIGKHKISMNTATSDSFKSFITTLIQLGQKNPEKRIHFIKKTKKLCYIQNPYFSRSKINLQ